ncbi:MAG: DUF3108 domain-containing protein [Candidatus Margulisiibacteriota bacterium]
MPVFSAGPKVGETLSYDVNYSGLNLGYFQIKTIAEYPWQDFISNHVEKNNQEYFTACLPPISTDNLAIVRLRVFSNVEQLDKSEDIYILQPSGYPLMFKQYGHQGEESVTYTDPFTYKVMSYSHAGSKRIKQFRNPVFDPVSLFFFLRYQDYSKSYNLDTLDQNFSFSRNGKETITSRGKQYNTFIVKSEPPKLTLWFTDNEIRLPVRIQYDLFLGTVVFELK